MSYPGYRLSRAHKRIRYTTGNITLNSNVTWADLLASGAADLVLQAEVGDEIEYAFNGLIANAAIDAFFDVVSVVSGSPVNSFAGAGAVTAVGSPHYGVAGWYQSQGRIDTLSGAAWYTVVAGDLASGYITLRPRYSLSGAGTRTLYASTANPLLITAKNIGPVDPN